MTAKAKARIPERDIEGRWLCNVVDNCAEPASHAGVVDCGAGCGNAAAEAQTRLDAKAAELAEHSAAIDDIQDTFVREGRPPTDIERFTAFVHAGHVQRLGTEHEQLAAAYALVAEAHTHPVMSCGTHKSRLPKVG